MTVTHPSTNRARRRVTSLIRPATLPLRNAANSLIPGRVKALNERSYVKSKHLFHIYFFRVADLWTAYSTVTASDGFYALSYIFCGVSLAGVTGVSCR